MRPVPATVRHDLSFAGIYRKTAGETVDIPITAHRYVIGTRMSRVTAAGDAGWSERTSNRSRLQIWRGDHFFPIASIRTRLQTAQSMFPHVGRVLSETATSALSEDAATVVPHSRGLLRPLDRAN